MSNDENATNEIPARTPMVVPPPLTRRARLSAKLPVFLLQFQYAMMDYLCEGDASRGVSVQIVWAYDPDRDMVRFLVCCTNAERDEVLQAEVPATPIVDGGDAAHEVLFNALWEAIERHLRELGDTAPLNRMRRLAAVAPEQNNAETAKADEDNDGKVP